MRHHKTTWLALATSTALALPAAADQQILDDLIVGGSACVGLDCNNGESFGFDTIRMKENNLRLHFDDTSNSASFPSNDWRIGANDSTNGGANKLFFEDSTAGRQVVIIEAGAPANAMVLDNAGQLGMGTSNPVVEMHVVDGDSPTLRLEQDGSSGFTPQTFDIAANEANFFVRDVTNGSKLPFKIKPGAPTDALFVAANGNIGMNTDAPSAQMHLRETAVVDAVTPHALVQNTNSTVQQRHMLSLENNGVSYMSLVDTSVAVGDNLGRQWNIFNDGGLFEITSAPGGPNDNEFSLDNDGNLTLSGHLITTGGGGACTAADPCDAVFDPDVYTVPSIEDHAALMWEHKHLPAVGPTGPGIPVNMTEKMLRMLNELEHAHIYIEQLHKRIERLEEAADSSKG
ncbi:MAG: hypothetical protein AAFN94_13475 [Pseudomonadota bacterium]